MSIGAGTIPQNDTLVTPIIQQLVTVAEQIQGLGTIYVDAPDAAPEDNSVLFAMRDFQVLEEANGLYLVELVFEILHVFTRNNLPYALARAYAALPAWLTVLTAWSNQTLQGSARGINMERQPCSIKGTMWGTTPYLAISTRISVVVELPINMS